MQNGVGAFKVARVSLGLVVVGGDSRPQRRHSNDGLS